MDRVGFEPTSSAQFTRLFAPLQNYSIFPDDYYLKNPHQV
jgi:hypothetical protein